jgi:hypothetical protein
MTAKSTAAAGGYQPWGLRFKRRRISGLRLTKIASEDRRTIDTFQKAWFSRSSPNLDPPRDSGLKCLQLKGPPSSAQYRDCPVRTAECSSQSILGLEFPTCSRHHIELRSSVIVGDGLPFGRDHVQCCFSFFMQIRVSTLQRTSEKGERRIRNGEGRSNSGRR